MPKDEMRLGESNFNYQQYNAARFLHYYQQIRYILQLRPESILEIGPGDHTVADFASRKGIEVFTLDNDEGLNPDYQMDLRKETVTDRQFDLVLASKVFEHCNISYLPDLLRHALAPPSSDGAFIDITAVYDASFFSSGSKSETMVPPHSF